MKNIWKKLPPNIRERLKPFASKAYHIFSLLSGNQALLHPVGKARVPYAVRPWLKRSFAQQGEDLLLDRIMSRILKWDLNQPRTYIDVGAYHPVDHSVTYLLYLRRWRGIAFDPSASTEKSFRKWRRRDTFVRAVVGDVDGINVDFFVPKAVDDMSLINTKYPENESKYRKVTHRQVSLNQELERQNVEQIDVFNLDIEGAEMEVLNTLDFGKYKPTIVSVEIHGNDIAKCLESEEAQFLISNGYICVGSAVITFFFVRQSAIDG